MRLVTAGIFLAACLSAQTPATPPKAEGLPPRATPGDYQVHAVAGNVTVAAEFTGHSVATPDTTLNTEEYVVVEVGLFGPGGTRLKISHEDFNMRINGKKALLPSQPYGLVVKTLKDPLLEPTVAETKSKTSVGTGGDKSNDPPPPYRVPDELRHAWSQVLQKQSLPEGDRALPQAGLIYFIWRAKLDKIQSIELIYAGPAGSATLTLQ